MKIKGLPGVFVFLLAIGLLPQLLNWVSQRLVFGLNPVVWMILPTGLLLVSIPILINWNKWAGKQGFVKGNIEPYVLFAMGIVCLIVSCIIAGHTTMDFHFHDTYYVVSNSSIALFGSMLFGIFCAVYYFFPVIFRRGLNISLSRFHFWITYVGLTVLFGLRYTGEIINLPRHYVNYSEWTSYQPLGYFNRYIAITVLLVLAAQLLFLFNIMYSLIKENKSHT